jgi:hypothetical protein
MADKFPTGDPSWFDSVANKSWPARAAISGIRWTSMADVSGPRHFTPS